MHEQYNDLLLEKLKKFCADNGIENMVVMLQTKYNQTMISKVFPNGVGHPFYVAAYRYLNESVKIAEADLLCENCRAAFTYEKVAVANSGPDICFTCPHCHSPKIKEL